MSRSDGMTVDPLNPFAPGVLADPYPLYARLRADDPVHWVAPWGPWFLTRYADVAAAQRDPRLIKRNFPTASVDRLPPEAREDLAPSFRILTVDLAYVDPPANTQLRAPVGRALSARGAEALRPRIQAIVDELIDAVVDAGRMDAIDDLAYPLPTLVGAALLGVPHGDLGQVRRWSEDIAAVFTGNPGDAGLRQRAKAATLALRDYFRDLLAARRACLEDDLMSGLIADGGTADPLSDDDLAALCMQLLFSGRGGTPLFLGNGLLALLQHPDELALLRGDPSLLPTAVEELLRYDAAPQSIARVAAEDLEIGGRRISKGQLVLLSLAAANRDPAEFPDPDRLDLTRRRNRHLTFGFAGHFCTGASLVRSEAQVAFGSIVRRLPGLRLVAEPLAWRDNAQERMLRSLPVTFTPAQAAVPG